MIRFVPMNEIEFHVFGHNQAARALYEQSGYEIMNVQMSKKIGVE